MLILKNIEKINEYKLNVKGKGYYFKGWDNTLDDVTTFALAEVGAPFNPLIHITLYKDECKWHDEIQNNYCYVYGIKVDGRISHHGKGRLNTPAEFRNTIEQILNGI